MGPSKNATNGTVIAAAPICVSSGLSRSAFRGASLTAGSRCSFSGRSEAHLRREERVGFDHRFVTQKPPCIDPQRLIVALTGGSTWPRYILNCETFPYRRRPRTAPPAPREKIHLDLRSEFLCRAKSNNLNVSFFLNLKARMRFWN